VGGLRSNGDEERIWAALMGFVCCHSALWHLLAEFAIPGREPDEEVFLALLAGIRLDSDDKCRWTD
jgi:hypothetical protein